jgi:2'-5' RNA ligase
MNEPSRVRAFLAIPPDPSWSASARALLDRLRPQLPPASWTRPESWHVTLKFLGEVSRDSLSAFAAAIGGEARRLSEALLSTNEALILPPRGPARVLGVGFGRDPGSGAVWELAREAECAARELGLEVENREFRPHVTFARLRRPWPSEAIARFRVEADAWAFPRWPVPSCVLCESHLAREGAVHTPVARWALGEAEVVSA